MLIERVLGANEALAQIRASHPPQPGARLRLADAVDVAVVGREGDLFRLRFDGEVLEVLERHGQVPLPPYITHPPDAEDESRYQTVYARAPGAVAAPTAGLHFDAPLLESLRARGVELAFLTLHVGAGTFQPVRTHRIADHRMHSERYEIPARDRRGRAARARARPTRSSPSGRPRSARSKPPRATARSPPAAERPISSSRPAIASASSTACSRTSTCRSRPCSCSFRHSPGSSRCVPPIATRSPPGTGSSATATRCWSTGNRIGRCNSRFRRPTAPRGARGSSSRTARWRRRSSCRSAPMARSRR